MIMQAMYTFFYYLCLFFITNQLLFGVTQVHFQFLIQKSLSSNSMASMRVDNTNKEADLLAMMMDSPRISITEFLQKEKQIMVDPLSLKESSIGKTTMLPTIITTTSTSPTLLHPPPLKPPKLRFLSLSLPNSAISSPKFASTLSNKKSSKGEGSPEEPQYQTSNLTNKLHNLLQEVHLRKSKSYGEGRESAYDEPLEEFDHWLSKLSEKENDKWEWNHPSFTKTEAIKESPKSVKL